VKDERFLHPLAIFEGGRIEWAFRKRNHLVPCQTRWSKTRTKQIRQIVGLFHSDLMKLGPVEVRRVDVKA
jgi:hypothetical protein